MKALFLRLSILAFMTILIACSNTVPVNPEPNPPSSTPQNPSADATGMLGSFSGQATPVADQNGDPLNATLTFKKFVDRHTYEGVTYGLYRGEATIDGKAISFRSWALAEVDAIDTPTEAYLQTDDGIVQNYEIEVRRSGDDITGTLLYLKAIPPIGGGAYEDPVEYSFALKRVQ